MMTKQFSAEFFPELLAGMLVNFEIAVTRAPLNPRGTVMHSVSQPSQDCSSLARTTNAAVKLPVAAACEQIR